MFSIKTFSSHSLYFHRISNFSHSSQLVKREGRLLSFLIHHVFWFARIGWCVLFQFISWCFVLVLLLYEGIIQVNEKSCKEVNDNAEKETCIPVFIMIMKFCFGLGMDVDVRLESINFVFNFIKYICQLYLF